MPKFFCAYDNEPLHHDELEYHQVPGRGSLPFCGPDCHRRMLFELKKSKPETKNEKRVPGTSKLSKRVEALENKLDQILDALKSKK